MHLLNRLVRSLRRRLSSKLSRARIKLGFAEPRMRYPFEQVMLKYPTGRPQYRWGTLCAAYLAKALGHPRISVIEFGVAGGGGLLKLEEIAAWVEQQTGVAIDVYGFDTGTGLTKPQDYRDLPQLWQEGDYKMDVERLRSRLTRARLVLGPVETTVPQFLAEAPAPVGFIAFDLDLYSSTMHAFQLFEGADEALLPRAVCYFDDIIGFSHGDFNGERLAIHEFNASHELRKISPIYGLRYVLDMDKVWTEMMFMFHAFDHARYNEYDGMNFIPELTLD